MRITVASLTLGLAVALPAPAPARAAGSAAPPADARDVFFAYIPPRAEGSAFVPRRPEATGSIPAPAAHRPPRDRGLPNQALSGIKGQKVVRDICIGCDP
ncbi:hypothetical protein M446_3001 [Methylobacterium sp. 4-46]|uniref:hypothetical protein n=1 Tax=unclassified Methylobacterium TaxID=2615210 RepID=UPI000152D9FB|nr:MULTISPECIES: hypothetical protein [Methylobacterium]ACA17413.1 hypothetical protein M446_3001 [Methylobacterium sp. 4-46]WFT83098.1 hypothetical protein QA634_15230 [Methylobacterium nodulans]